MQTLLERSFYSESQATYPRLVTSIHQIEITSRCNLACVYCPSPHLQRPKIDMDFKTYLRALEWVETCVKKGTQTELNLAGIGESTMHPDFIDYVRLARETVGPYIRLVLATNGLLITEEMVKKLQPYDLRVWVSVHRPEKCGRAIGLLREYGLFEAISTDPATSSIAWAGQVDWKVTAPRSPCPWLTYGWVMVMADGRLTTCCLDASGVGVVGHIDDEISEVYIKPYKLCDTCEQAVP